MLLNSISSDALVFTYAKRDGIHEGLKRHHSNFMEKQTSDNIICYIFTAIHSQKPTKANVLS